MTDATQTTVLEDRVWAILNDLDDNVDFGDVMSAMADSYVRKVVAAGRANGLDDDVIVEAGSHIILEALDLAWQRIDAIIEAGYVTPRD